MITASIVLYKNDLEECHRILDCLIKAHIDRIYLVDHSGDTRLSVLEEQSDTIEYIPHENLGYGAGHNIAIKKAIDASSKYHLIVNSDIFFEEGTIEKIVDYMEKDSSVAHIMPKVYYPNGELQHLCKFLPTPFDLFVRGFLPGNLIKEQRRRFVMAFTGYNRIINAPYLSGCFMFIRTDVLQEIGGFDERFFMYPEDIDLTRRIHKKYKTIMYPAVSIVHDHKAAHRHSLRLRMIMIFNLIKYFNKWGWFFDKERKQFNERLLDELAQ